MTAETSTAQQVTPEQISAYLAARGWERADERAASVRWSLDDDGRRRSVVVLRDPQDPDFPDYLAVLLARLRSVEKREDEAILRDIAEAARDTLLISVSAPQIRNGEIPMSYGSELFGGVRDLIVAGSRSLKATRANFAGPTPEDIMGVLERLTFGTTREGSYVMTVKTPIEQQEQLPTPGAEPVLSFERRAVARTIEAVEAAQRAAGEPHDEDAVDESIERGVSAQLCKALARIDPGVTGVRVEFMAMWSAALPRPTAAPHRVELHSPDLSHVRQLGDMLGQLSPDEHHTIDGWIRSITYDALGETRGVATVEARIKGRRRDVRLELEGAELADAHRLAGKGHISATGTLEKAGRAWVLSDPHDLLFREESG